MAFVRAWRAAALLVLALLLHPGVPTLLAQPSPTAIVGRVRIDTRRPIDFHAAAFPETLYVGQQSTYQLAVFLTPSTSSRLRRNPEFIPPELRGLLAYELGSPRNVRTQAENGAPYEAIVFQRALFPVAAGALAVPAPQLSYALPPSSSYYSREERHEVRAESAHLVVRALPLADRPANFSGAVGVLRMTPRIDTAAARVGDPLVLTLRVQGVGNVKLLPRPAPEIEWASAVPGTERVQVDTSGPLVRGAKEFDWVLTPTRSGRVTLPSLSYDYFDPYLRRYAVAVTLPVEFEVRPGALAEADLGESAALLPLRESRAGSLSRRGLPLESPASRVAVLTAVLLAPLPALMMALRLRRRRTPREAPAAGATRDTLRDLALVDGDGGENARRARRALHAALASRLGVPPQSLVSRRQLRRVLRRRGVTRAGTDRVLHVLAELDAHGFAGQEGEGGHVDAISECYAIVDAEAVRGGAPLSSRFDGTVTLALLAAGALLSGSMPSPVHAASSMQAVAAPSAGGASPASAIRAAVAAYESRAFGDAAQRFGDLVAASPRNVDLLANWGTAAWSAGDTVHAVIAWQRAARLDPLAVDLQQRVGLLPAGARGGIADVPMVPVPMLTAIALACWLIAWGCAAALFARRARSRTGGRGPSWLRGLLLTTLFVAIVAGAFAWRGHRQLDATRLSVVARPETMHIAPGADADAMGGVTTGDVVRRLDEEAGGWLHVQHADGRRGWLPAMRLVPLLPAGGVASADAPSGPALEVPTLSPVDATAPAGRVEVPATRSGAPGVR